MHSPISEQALIKQKTCVLFVAWTIYSLPKIVKNDNWDVGNGYGFPSRRVPISVKDHKSESKLLYDVAYVIVVNVFYMQCIDKLIVKYAKLVDVTTSAITPTAASWLFSRLLRLSLLAVVGIITEVVTSTNLAYFIIYLSMQCM